MLDDTGSVAVCRGMGRRIAFPVCGGMWYERRKIDSGQATCLEDGAVLCNICMTVSLQKL